MNVNDIPDLSDPNCVGCIHRHAGAQPGQYDQCRRFPPTYTPPAITIDAAGEQIPVPGGWSFPPAIRRCGEFSRKFATN